MKLSDLRTLTRFLVGDTQGTTYTDALVNEAVNYAVKSYATKTEATYKETDTTVDANGFVTIDTTVLTNGHIRIKRVMYERTGGADPLLVVTPKYQLVESTFSFESMKSATWQKDSTSASNTGPSRWVLWSGQKIKLTPLISTWGSAPVPVVTVGYIERPVALASDNDTVDSRIPEAHQDYLKYAAASYLLLLDGDAESVPLADNHMQRFNQLIGYSDPVLETKMAQSRTQSIREV